LGVSPLDTDCNQGLEQRVSEHTLHKYLTSIYAKLEVANRLELFVCARKHGLDKLPA
jgi:DNA-binding NarL/FixJ family response regulator